MLSCTREAAAAGGGVAGGGVTEWGVGCDDSASHGWGEPPGSV